tara:strand:- start:96098 stop:98971 length:2874 start_codon:yes stop_codon:yes gene_type:complete
VNRATLPLLLIFALASCRTTQSSTAQGSTALGSTAQSSSGAKPGEFSLEYERYRLANGLTVILHKDASDPIVAMATVVHVGSSRERPGRTGFAHFFEHMSFNNSENVPMGANRKMIPELGGTRNGGTWEDATIYYEVVPKDAFETLMWIDSDRFGYMINTVKGGTLEREKQVVKNEKRQRVDNRAYGHTGHVIRKALYPAEHPYSWTVIGDLEDLQNATLDDVREFYKTYYVPANATLVISGDIDVAETKAMTERWFGEIAAGPAVEDMAPMPVSLAAEKRLSHLDTFAKTAELRLTLPTVEQSHDDSFALTALGEILANGKTAPLFTTVVMDEKLSSSVSAYQDSGELAGTFTIRVRANPGVDLDAVYASIAAAMKRFETEGIRDADLQRYKAGHETAFYSDIASVLDRALKLGIDQEFAGDPMYMHKERARVDALTPADLMRVYEKYIKGKPAIITSFVPKAHPALALQGSSPAPVKEEEIIAGAEKDFVETDADDFERTPSKHDRSQPALGPLPVANIPESWEAKTAGGIAILGMEHRELPVVEFSLRIDGGQRFDSAKTLGAAVLTADLMNEGTRSKTPAQLQDAIDLLGSTLRIEGGPTSIRVYGKTLKKNFEPTIELLREMLLEPRWDTAEFARLKSQRLARIEELGGNARAVARNAFFRRLYGETHVAGQPLGGTASTVAALTLADLQRWYAKYMTPGHATFHVVGDIAAAEVSSALASLDAGWKGEDATAAPFPALAKTSARLFFIDMPGAKQSVLYMGRATIPGDDPRFYRLTVANNRLGAGSSARLTQTLRIAKGYTYGAYSSVQRAHYPGAFVATSQVRSNVTLPSLEIFKELIGNYAQTFGEADLATTKNLIGKGNTRRFETLGGLLAVLETMSRFALPKNFIAKESAELAKLTLKDVHSDVGELLPIDDMIVVVVGDGETQLAGLEKLGLGAPVLLDRKGQRIP